MAAGGPRQQRGSKGHPGFMGSGPEFRSPAGCALPWPDRRDGGVGAGGLLSVLAGLQAAPRQAWAFVPRESQAETLPSSGRARRRQDRSPATATDQGWRPENLPEALPWAARLPEPTAGVPRGPTSGARVTESDSGSRLTEGRPAAPGSADRPCRHLAAPGTRWAQRQAGLQETPRTAPSGTWAARPVFPLSDSLAPSPSDVPCLDAGTQWLLDKRP